MLPFLAVLAVAAARGLPWRRWHFLALAALAGLAVWWCAKAVDDVPLERRVVILRVTLALAAIAFVAVAHARTRGLAASRHLAVAATICAAALSIGICLGIDLKAWIKDRNIHDDASARIAAATPHRFALIGLVGAGAIDSAATLRSSRDLQYADIDEVEGHIERFRPLVDYWLRERRPVFAIMPSNFVSPWPDFRADIVDARVNLWSLQPR
jgi:hypothetical protein